MFREKLAISLVRIGLGAVFVLTGYFIMSDDSRWTYFLSGRIVESLFFDPRALMTAVAIFDFLAGIWLLTGFFPSLAGLLATLHLISVLIVSGIGDATYRDIGLMFSGLAVFLYYLPPDLRKEIFRKKPSEETVDNK